MEQNDQKSKAIKWLLIVLAVALVLFVCWKAGWILSGDKNNVSEQEKQEAVQEAVDEVNATIEAEQTTVLDANTELDGLHEDLENVIEDLQELRDDLQEELKNELNEENQR